MNQSRWISIFGNYRKVGFRYMSSSSSTINQNHNVTSEQDSTSINEEKLPDKPVKMENPFQKEKRQCILCKYQITPNYKNVRLLSQFVSRFTGKTYGRHITGLCKAQQKKVEREIFRAQSSGLMACYYRDPRFAHDPKLYDPDRSFRPHRF